MEEGEGVARCAVCGVPEGPGGLRQRDQLTRGVSEALAAERPDLPPDAQVCPACRSRLRRAHVERLLEAERGELGALDREVLASLEAGAPVAANVEEAFAGHVSLGTRAADTVAALGGSWGFIAGFCAFLALWMAANVTGVLFGAFDPYPFILLNLMLSCVAALQAPIIMMSQRRQEAKDRMRAENDYKVNLKAELEIRHLHEKLDHQLARQWERLVEIQRIQIEMLEEMAEAARPG